MGDSSTPANTAPVKRSTAYLSPPSPLSSHLAKKVATDSDIEGEGSKKPPSNDELMCTILSLKGDIINRMDNRMDKMEKDLGDMKSDLGSKIDNLERDFGKSLENTNMSVNENLEATKLLREENQNLREKVDQLEDSNRKLQVENSKIKEDLVRLECHSRRNNLLFTGFSEERNEGERKCLEKVMMVLREAEVDNLENIVINRCHRTGQYIQGKNRPIIANFQSFLDRQHVYKSRGVLAKKKSQYFINEDFPQVIRQRRAKLLPIVNAAKQMPAYKDKVYLSLNKLVVNNIRYTVDNLDLLSSELNPRELCHRESSDGKILCFFSKYSPLAPIHKI